MRAALGMVLLTCMLTGCVGAEDGTTEASGPACAPRQVALVTQTAAVVFPGDVPAEVRSQAGDEPRISIEVWKGQAVRAFAAFAPTAGGVVVRYDGPKEHVDVADGAWASYGHASGHRNVTLDLVGQPLASLVSYTLVLDVLGCPVP
jgi:hypothetical protein